MRIDFAREIKGFGYINYIDDDFKCYYAPDTAKCIEAIWEGCTDKERKLLIQVLEKIYILMTTEWKVSDRTDWIDKYGSLLVCAKYLPLKKD